MTRAGCIVLGLATACRPTSPVDTASRSPGAPGVRENLPGETITAPPCGAADVLLGEPESLPDAPNLAAILNLADPDLAAALTQLARFSQRQQRGLPVPAAFAMAQWVWEVPLVRQRFAELGFAARDLVALRFDRRAPQWLLPLGCTIDQARRRLTASGRFELLDLGDGVLATPRRADFVHDVVVVRQVVILTPAGAGRATLGLWRAATDPAAHLGPARPGQRLAQLPAAPIRVVLSGPALLEPGAFPEANPAFVVDAQGVQDATVPGP